MSVSRETGGPRRTLLAVGVALAVLGGALLVQVWLHPPPPPVAASYGLEGERYAPDVLGLDASGRLFVGDAGLATPVDGSVDVRAAVEVARSRWAVRPRVETGPAFEEGLEWQVLALEPDVPLYRAEQLVEALSSAGVVRLAFTTHEGTAAGPGVTASGLLHLEVDPVLGRSCGAPLDHDESILGVRVEAAWEPQRYRWGALGTHLEVAGDLAALGAAAASPAVEYSVVDARPDACWGDVLAALLLLDRAGLEPCFPFVVEADF